MNVIAKKEQILINRLKVF